MFDRARKDVFLEWFAATCNAVLSAEKAGVAYQTPFKHRMKDPEFEAEWDAALAQGYARLEARTVQEAHEIFGQSGTLAEGEQDSPSTSLRTNGESEGKFNVELALLLLREYRRRLPGSADKRKNMRPATRVATEAEVIAALEKRLKGFALRQSSGRALRASKKKKK